MSKISSGIKVENPELDLMKSDGIKLHRVYKFQQKHFGGITVKYSVFQTNFHHIS